MKRWGKWTVLTAVILLVTLTVSGSLADFSLKNWMKYLPDNMQLSQVNIPGTHDSGTARVLGGKIIKRTAECQDWFFEDQLEMGLRVFDLRFQTDFQIDDYYTYNVNHNHIPCLTKWFMPLTLDDVMKAANTFVEKHPSETVILNVCAEGFNTEFVNGRLKKLIGEYDATRPSYSERKYSHGISFYSDAYSVASVPALKDLRGKVVILFNQPRDMYTTYEMQYEDYDHGEDDKEPGVNPEKKSVIIKTVITDAIDNKWYQQYNGGTDKFFDTGLRNHYPGRRYGNPDSPKVVGTNLTGLYFGWGFIWKLIIDRTPEPLADAFFDKFEYTDKVWPVSYRYGWVTMDFPRTATIRHIIRSNFGLPTYLYNVKVKGYPGELTLENLNKLEITLNGLNEQPKWEIKPEMQGFETTSTVFQYKYAPRETMTWKNPAHPNDIYARPNGTAVRIDGKMYDIRISRSVTNMDPNSTDPPGVWGIITEEITLVPMGDSDEFIDVEGMVYWNCYPTDGDYHPKTTDDFLEKCGTMLWKATDGNGDVSYMTLTGNEAVAEKSSYAKYDTSQPDKWPIKGHFPKYGAHGEMTYQLVDVTNQPEGCPYNIGVDGLPTNNVYISVKSSQFGDKQIADFIWVDNNDEHGLRTAAADAILGKKTSSKFYLELRYRAPDGSTTFRNPDPELFFEQNNTKLSAHKVYDPITDWGKQGVSNFYMLDSWVTSADRIAQQLDPPDFAPYSYKQEGNTYTFTLNTKARAVIHWEGEGGNYGDYRGDGVFVVLKDTATGYVAEIPVSNEKTDGNYTWDSERVDIPLYYSESGDPADAKEVVFDDFEIMEEILPRYYDMTVTTRRETDALTGLPEVVIDVTLKLRHGECLQVDGHIEWVDGDLDVPHLAPVIRLLADGAVKPDLEHGGVDLVLSDLNRRFSYEPFTNLPLRSYVYRNPIEYTVEADPVDGYLPPTVNGFTVTYLRKVTLTGEVTWADGSRVPTAAAPTVELLRDGEPAYESVACVQTGTTPEGAPVFTYSFDELPISALDGDPCRYSAIVSLPGYDDVFVNMGEASRDANTGNFRQDAVLSVPEKTADAEIPVKLNLEGITPDEVNERFLFLLECPDDPDFIPQTMTLSQENGFTGTFTVSGLRDNVQEYDYTARQVVNSEKTFWEYDDASKGAAVTLRFLSGDQPVAQVDMGGSTQLEFTNVFTGEVPVQDLPVRIEWINAQKYRRTVPESVNVTLLANNVRQNTLPVSAAEEWFHLYEGLPLYDLIPSNGAGYTWKPIDYNAVGDEVEGFAQSQYLAKDGAIVIRYAAQKPVPPTGDATRLAALALLALASAAGAFLLARGKRREDR